MTENIAIIGFGNIASAIVTPLLDNKLILPENVFSVVNSEIQTVARSSKETDDEV